MNLLYDYLKKLEIPFDESIINKFEIYYNILIEWNQKFNLTSITEKDEVIVKHFADSLCGYKFISNAKSVVDVGAGAGFPSLPLAIVCPNISFTLVDSLNKRINFLNEVINVLKLKNVVAVHSRAEDFAKDNRGTFDIATARAVASLPTLLEYLIPLVKVGGKAVCFKALNVENEIIDAQNAIKKLNAQIEQKYDYQLNDNFRSIVVVKAIKECNKCYPRSGNKPKSNPL